MKILYGTCNNAKLSEMKKTLEIYNEKMNNEMKIEIIGLKDLNQPIPQVAEDGDTPLENAQQKAFTYYEAFRMPVFSCDSGLYFENLPDEVQPGVHVRTVNGKRLNDDEMIAYYSHLAQKYGDLKCKYKNAICFIFSENKKFESMDSTLESEKFIITSKPHKKRRNGFPLDCLSINIENGKYYYDIPEQKSEKVANGFIHFFEKALGEMKDLLYK